MSGWKSAHDGEAGKGEPGESAGLGGRPPRHVAESLDRVIAGLGGTSGEPAPTATGSAGLFSRWAELVGPDISARTRPLGVQHGELVVAVDDPAWASQLRWLATDLLARIAAAGGPQLVGLQVRVKPR